MTHLRPMPVFVLTHRPHEVRVAGATTFTFVPDVRARTNPAVIANWPN
jgi:hypothetical protein